MSDTPGGNLPFRPGRRSKYAGDSDPHCLFAANDSPEFRLIHAEQVGPESLLFGGIRLITGVQSNGSTHGTTSGIWKDLTIRAERITDWPATDHEAAR